ncbi:MULTISPECIES: LacI family DNA-binding transcriptional regulator [unclassified Actinomyces]|uniref:LacI family DNA-binding transcriptional regulator n=1 Tax=unclassified Actinomyces TaxID=2609248 RepID=UPI002016B6FC|nr:MULTISPECIES: LacI family DNA-binding transcriptional regulator [unclassified Actinomyces]MCL3777094.1 LacI family DNA-binding transcriptional regulator [Actinomyces sp. AC-20-1]MCL3789894.1 LacI family DNA-binding transcriptional regulator [Actinomyces sp. 187325]MCL3792582.1 LacI family DNA-binding transcriptional regulator [Actinomyces sp. 186855]MCL3794758.1 LacI family DNA-binding transcriptional regulator [Actinomyces sp. 217892]
MSRPTLKDIAEATGYSVSTVSRALADSAQISERTRHRIHEVSRRLGYQADPIGSLLRTPRPRVIGLLCVLGQELHVVYRDHLLAEAESRNLRVVTESIGPFRTAVDAVSNLRQLRCQALVVIDPATAAGADPGLLDGAVVIGQERGIPGADLVTSDNTRGMDQLVAHLASLGHRRLVYVDSVPGASAAARLRSFTRAADHAGISYRVVAGGADIDAGLAAVAPLLGEGGPLSPGAADRHTGVVCYNDQCAQGAIIAILRAGLRPGTDISVAGVDNSRLASSSAFDLTSIDRCPGQVARLAVDLAEARIESGTSSGPLQTLTVDTSLVARSSTGPAPQ